MNMTDPVADMLTRIRNAVASTAYSRTGSGLENEAGNCACAERRRLH